MSQAERRILEQPVLPVPIIPGTLYLGSYDTASRSEVLKAMGITHILNVGRALVGARAHAVCA
jgi:dual specificity MAP kinase phosphatase